MTTLAAVDIGANSVRLKIARLRRKRLVPVAEDREVVRLGESVFGTGHLDPQAMAQTVKILRRFHKTAQKYDATNVRVVATSSLRDATNSSAFIDWVKAATGWRVEVISGLEEGRLIHLGVIANTRLGSQPMLLIDLGGGSCELTISSHKQIRDIISLPLGAVRLTRNFLQHDPPRRGELERMHAFIGEEVGRIQRRMSRAGVQVCIATSGTAAALSEIWAARRATDSSSVPRNEVLKIAKQLSKLSLEGRRKMSGVGLRRSEIIIAGAAVYGELLSRLGLSSFRYLPLGLRDGVLAQMVSEYDKATGVAKQVEAEKQNSVIALADRYGVDKKFAERVKYFATELFRKLKPLHGLPPEYEQLIGAAAMLHEIGAYINRAGRFRHAHYLITHSEIFGFTRNQRAIIAALARYMGRSKPRSEHYVISLLPEADRYYVQQAIVLLKLALALDQSRAGVVKKLGTRLGARQVGLTLSAKRTRSVELELWAVEKERSYFRAVFGRDLVASVA